MLKFEPIPIRQIKLILEDAPSLKVELSLFDSENKTIINKAVFEGEVRTAD